MNNIKDYLATLTKEELTEYVKDKRVMVKYSAEPYIEGGSLTLCHMDIWDSPLYNKVQDTTGYILGVSVESLN